MIDSTTMHMLCSLAGKWQHQADSDTSHDNQQRRETLRACADTLRMLCEALRMEDAMLRARENKP
jgi:hypothetical protein